MFGFLGLVSLFVIFSFLLHFFTAGVRIGLFTPGQAFDVVCRKQIEALKIPSTKVVDLVTQEINAICQGGTAKVIIKPNFQIYDDCQTRRATILSLP